MEEKIFIADKSKNKNLPSLVAIIVIVSLLSGTFGSILTYEVFKNKSNINEDTTRSDINGSNVNYKIEQTENPVVAIADAVGHSVVGVKVQYVTQGNYGLLKDSGSEGSGIIYSEDGYIVTNYHVISSAISNSTSNVSVILPNTSDEIPATIVGGDKVTDLAVLKIDKTGLAKAKFGKSSDVKVGGLAVAIGNPLGEELANTVTGGYISAVNRKITMDGQTYNLIQTDAAINPGNSGGALVNSNGEVVGINTSKVSEEGVEGLGFAIPVDDAIPVIEELIKNKKIVRPYIGIAGFDLDEQIAKQYNLVKGVYVSEVSSNTPAQKAGIKSGDIITMIGDKNISTMAELNAEKNNKKVGDTVTLKLYRAGKYMTVSLTLEEDISTSD